MSATIKGSGIFWSIGGITFSGGIVAYVQNGRVNRTSDKSEVKDDGGTIKAVAFSGFKKAFSVTIIPYGANLAAGKTMVNTSTPTAGTTVTITDASGTIIGASYNTITATQNRTVDGVVTVDLELEGSDESQDITTAIT